MRSFRAIQELPAQLPYRQPRATCSSHTFRQQVAKQGNGLTEGLSPRWSAITPPKYSAKNTKETETILTKAPEAPKRVAKCGMTLTIRAVPKPAPTDAAKNFQMTANTGPIPRPIGFPAYQKPGNIRRKYEIVQAKAIPEGPQCKASKNRARGTHKLHQAPAKPSLRATDRKMNPSVRVIQQHDSDSRAE